MSVESAAWDIALDSPSQLFDGVNFRDGKDTVLGIKDGRVAYLGERSHSLIASSTTVIDCQGYSLSPGLIDCHTHIVFGGNRSDEFSQRAAGASYEDILAAGGGIHNTVRATRLATASTLESLARQRLDTMLSFGVTTVEAKSGYGLDLENELKILRVIKELSTHPIECIPTCLAAHVVPKEFKGDKNGYLNLVIEEILPKVVDENLCRFVDIFVEENAFTLDDAAKLFEAANELELKLKVHAEQLSHQGSAELAGSYQATSADHLEYISDAGIEALLAGNTTPVLLPSCNLFLRQERVAPARKLIEAGCNVALSTDCNPGSSMVENLLLCMSLAMTQLQMTAQEVWCGVTKHAAAAIDRPELGQLKVGSPADIAIFETTSLLDVPYRMGSMRASRVYKAGTCVYGANDIIDDAAQPTPH